MRSTDVAIIINTAANAGRAASKWERIKKEVQANFKGNVSVMPYMPPFDLRSYVRQCAGSGIRNYIVGGGDGTLNYAANILYELEGEGLLENYALGALGLGSSNDFFKPSSRRIQNIPVRIDLQKATPSDRGLVRIANREGETCLKVFLVNAGLGVISQANYLFNHPNTLIHFLKPRATPLAIVVTALLTIFRHTNKTIDMGIDNKVCRVDMSNVSITIVPFISGSFRYKEERDKEGVFDVYLCHDMGRMELLKTLIDLSKGTFGAGKNRVITTARTADIVSEEEIPLELDGEILTGNSFQFELNRKAILLAP